MAGYIFVTPGSDKQVVQLAIDNCYILAFDLDNTLITTKSGKIFAADRDDWKWKYSNIFERINKSIKLITEQTAINTRVAICIITNQLGVKKNKVSASDIKIKLTRIVNELSMNIHEQSAICVIASIEDDLCRKPRTQSLEIIQQSLSIRNILGGAYVGDASGYVGSWSDVDRKFAINADFDFYSDYEYFNSLKANSQPVPATLLEYKSDRDINNISYKNISESIISNDKCLIIMCGSPASGKSTFIQNVKKELENSQSMIVSQDELKTKAKCKKTVVNYMRDSSHSNYIFIDNCNVSKEVRDEWIDLANKYHYSHLIFYLKTSKELSIHLNTHRKLNNGKIVPAIAIHSFFKKLEEPVGQGVKTFSSKEIIESSAMSSPLLFQYL